MPRKLNAGKEPLSLELDKAVLRLERLAALYVAAYFFAAPIFSHYACAKGGRYYGILFAQYRVSVPPPKFPYFYHSGRGGALTVLYGNYTYFVIFLIVPSVFTDLSINRNSAMNYDNGI